MSNEKAKEATPQEAPELPPGHGNFSVNEPPGSGVGAPAAATFTVTAIEPVEAAIGDPDVTLSVFGTGFAEGAQIVFNGGAEVTDYIDEGELTTLVKPSTATTTGDYPVTVTQGGVVFGPPQTFSFTEPVEDAPTRSAAKRKR